MVKEKVSFETLLTDVYTNVSKLTAPLGEEGLFPIPERAPVFSLFKRLLLVKKGYEAKEKSRKGFIWVDTDPWQILCNRLIITSCCNITDKGSTWRGSNYNHAYNPNMASIFANDASPKDSKKEFPVSGYPSFTRYQATANIFFMRDSAGRPYIYMNRCYDSCYEVPWTGTVYRYLKERCQRNGIGLAVCYYYSVLYPTKTTPEKLLGNKTLVLVSPSFATPFRYNKKPCVLSHSSDYVYYRQYEDGRVASYVTNAREILEPTLGPEVNIGLGEHTQQGKYEKALLNSGSRDNGY